MRFDTPVSDDKKSPCQQYIDVYLEFGKMGYNAFSQKATDLMDRLLKGDDVDVYEMLNLVKNFLPTFKYGDFAHFNPEDPYNRAESILCDVFNTCWTDRKNGDDEYK